MAPKIIEADFKKFQMLESVSRSGSVSFLSFKTTGAKIILGLFGFSVLACLAVAIGVVILLLGRTTTTSTTVTTATTTTTSTTSATTATTTTTTTTLTTVTFIPVGIWALNIPPCAIWNQTATTVAGNPNGTAGSDAGSLRAPVSIFVDNNNTLYVCDRDNHRIVKYDQNARVGVVVAGNGTVGNTAQQLNAPKGVAVDQGGDVIVADSVNYRIQRFASGSLTGTTVAFNSTVNRLGHTRDLQIDVNNNVYVTDSDNSQILKFIPGNGIAVVLVGSSGAGSGATQLNTPFGTFIDSNQSLYIADYGNHRVQKWDSGATNGTTVAGVSTVFGSTLALLRNPVSVIVDNNGYMYIADSGNARIIRWTSNYAAGGTCIVGCTGSTGSGGAQLRSPRDLKFDRYGNIYVSDQGNHRVQKFDIDVVTGCTGK